jgi:hypothetical protein
VLLATSTCAPLSSTRPRSACRAWSLLRYVVCPAVPAHCDLVVRRAVGSVGVHQPEFHVTGGARIRRQPEENRQYGSPGPSPHLERLAAGATLFGYRQDPVLAAVCPAPQKVSTRAGPSTFSHSPLSLPLSPPRSARRRTSACHRPRGQRRECGRGGGMRRHHV